MDACVFASCFWIAAKLRAVEWIIREFGLVGAPPENTIFWFFLLLIPMAPLVLEWQGYYNVPLIARRWEKWWALAKSCVIVTVSMVLLAYFFQLPFARLVVIWFGGISFVVMACKDEVLRRLSTSPLMSSHYTRRILLLGPPSEMERMKSDLGRLPLERVEAVAAFDLSSSSVDTLVRCLHEHAINVVVISGKHLPFDVVEAAVRACELEGVEVWLVADFFRTELARTTFDDFAGRPVLVFRAAPEASWQSLAKQLLDLTGSAALVLLLSPLLLLLALLVKWTSPGPVLFRQKRAGLNGRSFTMLKFRTMVSNAEQLKQELEALNEMSGPVFKVTNDPRITPIGRFLRKYSLDELPQLFNVLAGDMSLVGPRPLPVDEVARFDDMAHRRRLSVRPGLTCLWQVSGRNDVKDFAEWVRLDLEYIDNWSLWLDLRILLKTIPAVFSGSGAK